MTAPDRHARQPLALWQAREVARRLDGRGATPARSSSITHVGRSARRAAPLPRQRGRQAAVRQGNRGRAARRRDRPGGAQHQGHADRHAGRADDGAVPAARDAVGRAGAAGPPRRACRGRSRPSRPCSGRRRASAPAASAASRSCIGCCRARPSSPSAATSIRGCASSTKGSYDAIVLACAGLERVGLRRRASRCALPLTACVPAPGQGAVGVERRATRRAALAALRRGARRRGDAGGGDRRADRRRGAGRRLPDADWRARAAARRPDGISSCTRRSRRSRAPSCAPWRSDALDDPLALGRGSARNCSPKAPPSCSTPQRSSRARTEPPAIPRSGAPRTRLPQVGGRQAAAAARAAHVLSPRRSAATSSRSSAAAPCSSISPAPAASAGAR